MAGKHQQIIVLENTPTFKTLATIDPAPYSELPFSFNSYDKIKSDWEFRGDIASVRNGTLFQKETMDSGAVLSLNVCNYQDHDYDIVTVLGIMDNIGIRNTKKLFIYGKKIGEQVISDDRSFYRNSTSWGIKPNDELLLKISKNDGKKYYEIIHNITHAQKKYEIEQRFSR